MKTAVAIFLLVCIEAGACSHCKCLDAEKLVDTIYVVEGGAKTRYPYGIMSVKTDNPKRVCLNTVKNNYSRWIKAGRSGCYLDFLADRYCPPSVDPTGNRNWKHNIKILNK